MDKTSLDSVCGREWGEEEEEVTELKLGGLGSIRRHLPRSNILS